MPEVIVSNPGEIRLDPTWPGLDLRPDEVEVDPETLDRVAGLVRSEHYAHMDGYSTGTLPYLRNAEMGGGAHWFGFWPTAEYMELGLEEARSTIVYYYEVLDQQVAAAADLFAATAEEYREVEQGLRSSIEATSAEGWDRLATPAEVAGARGPAAGGLFQGTTPITGIMVGEDTSDYDADWIMSEIGRIKENETWRMLGLRGDTFVAVADRLEGVASKLKTQAQTLAQEWNSETSIAAQRALQLIAGTATHLAEASREVADYAYRSGEALQMAVNDFPKDSGVAWYHDIDDAFGAGHLAAKHNEIRQKLATLNESYTHINNLKLPKQISAQLPQLTEIPPPPEPPERWRDGGGGGGGGVGGGGVGGGSEFVPSSPPRMPTVPGGDVGSSGSVPERFSGVAQAPGPGAGGISGSAGEVGGPAGTGGLAGVGPGAGAGSIPGGIPAGLGAPGGGAGLGPGGPGGAGVVPGGGAGAVGPSGVGVVPGGVGAAGRGAGGGGAGGGAGRLGAGGGAGPAGRGGGVMGMPMGGAGGAGASDRRSGGKPGGVRGAGGGVGARPGGAGAGGSSGPAAGGGGGAVGGRGGVAGGMMPMGGAAGRGSEDKHSRPDSWLVEDDDPWAPDDDVPPGVIR